MITQDSPTMWTITQDEFEAVTVALFDHGGVDIQYDDQDEVVALEPKAVRELIEVLTKCLDATTPAHGDRAGASDDSI